MGKRPISLWSGASLADRQVSVTSSRSPNDCLGPSNGYPCWGLFHAFQPCTFLISCRSDGSSRRCSTSSNFDLSDSPRAKLAP
jgi:hypothetical protein